METEQLSNQLEADKKYMNTLKELKDSVSKNYSNQITVACADLGASLFNQWKASNPSSASSLTDTLAKMNIKVNVSGDIKKFGDDGYDNLPLTDYPEISCFDLDGFYDSSAYASIMTSISEFLNSKNLSKSSLNEHTSPSSSSSSLNPGLYQLEVAGAGGGGAGGNYCGHCKDGADGGKGDLQIKYVYISSTQNYNYVVGAGGNRGCGSGCSSRGSFGKDGGTSSFSLGSYKISALGGKGAKSATSGWANDASDGEKGADAGNGKGASGGDGVKCNKCADNGSNGWVKIYLISNWQ